MLETLRNAWKVQDLRKKILYTAMILLVFRIGANIPVPFIDTNALSELFAQLSETGSALSYLNIFTGGGLSNATLFAMSISPYINASIILQLLTVAIPALEAIAKEGEEGRRKIASWTRYLTVVIGLIQGFSYYVMLRNYNLLSTTHWLAVATLILTFMAGSAVVMWLGEHITEHGIGNGISIILFAGIISRGPQLIQTFWNMIAGAVSRSSTRSVWLAGRFTVASPPICRLRSTRPALCRLSSPRLSCLSRLRWRCSGLPSAGRWRVRYSACLHRPARSISCCTRC